MNLTLSDYKRLAKDYSLIPVCHKILADTETPVTALQRFSDSANVFLLESVEGGETWGRYSFIGVDPQVYLEIDHTMPDRAEKKSGLEALRSVYRDVKTAPIPGLPRFFGGVVGFIGYEAVGEFERLPFPKVAGSSIQPRSCLLKVDKLVVFDNVCHTITIIVCSHPSEATSVEKAYTDACRQIRDLVNLLSKPVPVKKACVYPIVKFKSNMTKSQFLAMVRNAKEYIVAGDIIQAVLSQRFSARTEIPAVQMYRALRLLNPSPYMYFLKIGEQTLVGSSPEVMVRLAGNRVAVRPIAGTRPRGESEQEDRRLADELLSDAKEKAEHIMLVDLGRNDLGRIAEIGSVQVRERMVIERYSHVMHIVSHVEGILRKDCDAFDVIRATFPAGTLTGAPKIRAMEIIHELESEPRGSYGGAVGYIGYDGNMDLAITIRTIEVSSHAVSIQAGAGIVFDSQPEHEFEETCHKALGMQKAVTLAANGLKLDDDLITDNI